MKFSITKNPRFIVITDTDIYIGNSETDVNVQAGGLMEKSEYKRIGSDYIAILSDSDLTFIQDKNRLANIPWIRLAKKDNKVVNLFYVMLLIQFILLMKG